MSGAEPRRGFRSAIGRLLGRSAPTALDSSEGQKDGRQATLDRRRKDESISRSSVRQERLILPNLPVWIREGSAANIERREAELRLNEIANDDLERSIMVGDVDPKSTLDEQMAAVRAEYEALARVSPVAAQLLIEDVPPTWEAVTRATHTVNNRVTAAMYSMRTPQGADIEFLHPALEFGFPPGFHPLPNSPESRLARESRFPDIELRAPEAEKDSPPTPTAGIRTTATPTSTGLDASRSTSPQPRAQRFPELEEVTPERRDDLAARVEPVGAEAQP